MKTTFEVVTYKNESEQEQRHKPEIHRKQAEKLATEWASKYPDELVYVRFFRRGDGQHGFLNQHGGASLSGKPWMV